MSGSDDSSGLSAAVQHLLNQHGGLQGLMQKFEEGGLGGVTQSWISGDTSQSVSPAQLHETLGPDTVQAAAQNSGMSTGDLLRQLSQHLPEAVNHMTPNGQMPTEQSGGWLDTAMNFLRSR